MLQWLVSGKIGSPGAPWLQLLQKAMVYAFCLARFVLKKQREV